MKSVKMRGLSNSSCLLFERKTNHVSTSNQITGGLKGPNQPLVTSQSFAQTKVRLAKIWWPLAARNVTGVYISKKERLTSRWWFHFFYFHPYILGERIQFDYIIFSGGVGWNHQPDMDCEKLPKASWVTIMYFFQPPKTYRNPNTLHLRYSMTG